MSNCLEPGPELQGGLLHLCRHDKSHACRNLVGCESARGGENGLVTLRLMCQDGEMISKKKKNRHNLVYTITPFCPFMLVCINSIFCFVSTTRTHSWSANPATGSGRQEILLVASKSWLAGQNSRDVNGNNDSTKETKIGTEDPLNSDITYSSIQHCSTDAEEGGGGGGANRNILLLSCFHCISPSYFNLQACGSLYDCTHATYNAAADTARSAWGC